jgi:peptide/nickel transport system permease protein
MLRYVMTRLAQAIPVIVATTLLTFMLLEVVPGDPIALMMREHIDADVVARVRKEMRLDDPWPVRYVRYMWDAVHGDFGTSYKIHRSVSELLANAFPKTLALTLAALIFAWGIGIPAGIVGALKHYSAPDYLVTLFSLIGVSVPVFWSGLIFQLIFGWKLGLLPITGYGGIVFLIMPGIVLGWSSAVVISRLIRSSLLEVLGSDFVRTARAKGLTQWAVVYRHALKNSLLPVVTIMAIQVADLLTGAVIVESVFGIPGIGRVSVSAIMNRDVPLLQGSVILTVVLVVLGNLLADVSYAFLDPRIRYE